MADLGKIANVDISNIDKIMGVSKSSLSKFMGLDLAAAGYVYHEEFTGSDDDPPNSTYWNPQSNPTINIQSNKLHFVATQDIGIIGKFFISGNFELEIEFSNLSHNNQNGNGTQISIADDAWTYAAFIKAGYSSGDKFISNYSLNSVWQTGWTVSRTNSYGKLGFKRTGSNISVRYADGAGSMTELYNANISSNNMKQYLEGISVSGVQMTADQDNYIIHTGTLVWP